MNQLVKVYQDIFLIQSPARFSSESQIPFYSSFLSEYEMQSYNLCLTNVINRGSLGPIHH